MATYFFNIQNPSVMELVNYQYLKKDSLYSLIIFFYIVQVVHWSLLKINIFLSISHHFHIRTYFFFNFSPLQFFNLEFSLSRRSFIELVYVDHNEGEGVFLSNSVMLMIDGELNSSSLSTKFCALLFIAQFVVSSIEG